MELRDYQRRDVIAIFAAIAKGQRILYVAPTGSGKTVTFVRVILNYVERGLPVVVLVHRSTLVEQAYANLLAAGIDASLVGTVWQKDRRANAGALVQVASVQTLIKRPRDTWPPAELLVVDEAHHAPADSWGECIAGYPNAKLLGATATPARLDGRPLSEQFDLMHVSEMPEALIARGFLSQADMWTSPVGHVDMKGVRKKNGDYDKAQTEERVSKRIITGDLVAEWKKHAYGLPSVCFAVTEKHGRAIRRAFTEADITAELLMGHTPFGERFAMVGPGGRLERGETKVVITCDVIAEGWDLPAVRCAILGRPTLSLRVFLQQCGRAMRPGERTPIILDHVGNFYLHGMPHHNREWSLTEPLKKRGGAPPAGVDADGRVVVREPTEADGELVRAEFETKCAVDGCNRQPDKRSLRWAKRTTHRAYCVEHKRVNRPPSAKIQCSVNGCSRHATRRSAKHVRQGGKNAYCAKHKQTNKKRMKRVHCSIEGCANYATKSSSRRARRRNKFPFVAYCEQHKGGPRLRSCLRPLPTRPQQIPNGRAAPSELG